MSKNVDFELNLPGLNELMKSGEMQAILKQAGASIKARAGKDFETQTRVLSFVAIQNVWPTTKDAYFSNLKKNTLVKAAGSIGLSMRG